jgi:large subunit ribosomal protein L22
MEVSASLNYLRIAPRKVRLVADLIRGKKVSKIISILSFTNKRAAAPLLKLIKSAVANAVNNYKLNPDNLFLKRILVNEGPKLKRLMPRARGQAFRIEKKTSHIIVVLDELSETFKGSSEKEMVVTKEISSQKDKVLQKKEEISKVKVQKPKEKITSKDLKVKKDRVKPLIQKGIKRIFRRKAF